MLEVRGLVVRIGDRMVLHGVDLAVRRGEVMALLGPSGSGKSTLLRAIAGLQALEAGSVWWEGEELTEVATHRRRFGLMFQDYALFPHLTVTGNVGYGLRMAGQSSAEVSKRVEEVLGWVGLAGFGRRRIEGLSGGEQQRVALARTLAPSPRLVMLDEPLGALDRQLRQRLTDEIRDLLKEHGITALYVTHDHEEAGRVGDRVAVMREGRIVQVGSLEELRSSPRDRWVGEFVR